ncbi:MAG: helix-turn-helix transcriptional regulator [Oscillospiraceae bacterium]|nr:helix-turn-helix transcriptional regulator [Oscillospiraceae bacterium]
MQYSGFLIRKKRLENDWSQEGLCKGICAVSYLSKIEQGKTEASEDILSALFAKLGISWLCDKDLLAKGKNFIEDWYDSAFSADYEKTAAFAEKYKKDFSALKNSCFAVDIMLLEEFSAEESRFVDERLEPCMDSRQLSLQRLFSEDFSEAAKLYPCAFMYFRAGVFAYEKGEDSSALENLQKAYSLAADEGRARIMMLSKLFMTNCYSNMQNIEAMERHGKIAKRLALELGEKGFAETVDYNFAATKIEVGDFLGAYDYFSKVENPTAPSLHKLAACCEKLGKKEEAFAAIEAEKSALAETEELKILADKACKLIKFRLENEDYLSSSEYGNMLLTFFDLCRKEMPIGYAKFHLPWVMEWYKANRRYKEACELLENFS